MDDKKITDGARWRWIRDHHHIANDNPRNWAFVTQHRGPSLTEAIDAEIRRERALNTR